MSNVAASVRARLLNVAKAQGVDFIDILPFLYGGEDVKCSCRENPRDLSLFSAGFWFSDLLEWLFA
ncbi:hypothetical protein [Plasticicumulans acidivorans]|uniref:Uncharacterized protein n=1 Tax=Plasticicumulans acidivorans TaxID=886464 RepID=A0A317MQ04_9GAMM|nr:hypothetical protein [Plasticicumulans acidivorans]PWV58312.1 hypothetical protein C7443_1203 [Plasticicumulans acidivorans]